MNPQLAHMETALPGLYASAPQALPFAPSLHVRAFLLGREHGNVLLYGVGDLASEGPAMEDLGGVSRHYLNHRHEAMFASGWTPAPLFVHQNERASVAQKAHVRGTFSKRHVLDHDFEVIPTPGHTSGATSYLWDSGGHRLLFTGDTIYLDEGEWVAAVLGSSDRDAYIESLKLMRELDFDVLVPWVASEGGPYFVTTGPADARRRIDAIIERIGRGQDR
jgi:glyoxylase-like metal-dependent hydrolase (beta-lactamase superfamily II)